ncbi:hypothetical protein H8959_013694 [Pygathrix nigripes]
MATGQKLMRAVRVFEFGRQEVLKLQSDIAVLIPKDHQVLIKVQARGVNPAETFIHSGTYSRKPPLPHTPGSDVAGMIEALRDKASAFKKVPVWKLEGVLVHGATGEVGLTACQIARPYGLKLLGTAGTEEGQKKMSDSCWQQSTTEINPWDTMAKESGTIGVTLLSSTKEEFQQYAAALQAGMEIGWLKPVIGSQYPLEKVAQAHETTTHGSGATGK